MALEHPDREAYVDGDARLTFAAWDRAADGVAARLEDLGVGRGDIVCVVLPSSIDYAITYQAAMRLGAITSGVNPLLGPREVRSILARTTPRVTVVDPLVAHVPEEAPVGTVLDRAALREAVSVGGAAGRRPELSETDPVAIVWTSGTTGAPKGAVFDHGCLKAMVTGAGALSRPGDRRLSPLPFAHVGYMTRPWDELVHVITTVIVPTPWTEAETLRLIGSESVTVGQGVPAQWARVLAHPALASTDLSSLRVAGTGAARVPAELVREMRDKLGCPVVVRYTSTEASVSTGTRLGDPDDVVANTVGRVADGVELRLVGDDGIEVTVGEVGEVTIRSRATTRGYWNDPERTAEVIDAAGWVHTGDLGTLDAAGNLSLVGRRTEMYIRGGYNVYPAEVEAALGEHPGVARVAVVGVADDALGQVGGAAIVPADRASPPSPTDLRAWCLARLAKYKMPDLLLAVDELPLTSMSKVDKQAVAALFGRGL
ncbi:MAG: class I adenylate-forming enzyme family protein [Acidimicrobiales bacterium]